MRTAAFVVSLLALVLARPSAQPRQTPALAGLLTRAERSDFRETSRYDDIVAFMEEVARAAPKVIRLTTFGYTMEGRPLPLAVVGAPGATPDAVRRTGKLRVYIQGNIHGGEVEGKESAQMLLRDVARGRHEAWLQSMVLLVAPIYNADGNERVSLTSRGRQHGPVGGMGQRANAQDLDLNRDHMKLDSPEARSFVKLMNDYDPHVSMDLHTTNGSYHAYHVTYAPPLNPATDAAIVDLLRRDWLPWLTKTVKQKHGWDFYYYGNVGGGGRSGASGRANSAQGGPRTWATFDHRPRFNNNYIGLRNRVAILSEAYSYATFEERIKGTSAFIEENLNYAQANAAAIRRLIEEADRRPLVGTMLPLRAELERSAGPVEILMGEVVEERNPYSGQLMLRRLDVRRPEPMIEAGTFRATETETVPSAYFVPPTLRTVLDRLDAHGIATSSTPATRTLAVEEFRLQGIDAAARPFQNRTERTLRGSWTGVEREIPAGTVRVDMRQPLARLAFYLLEPRSDDGLANWNLVDGLNADAPVYPVVRMR